jgi:hypothetical protein
MLSNFQVGNHSMVQSFLVGQPEFRGVMQRPEMRQLKQRIIASYHLGPLDRHETQSYIEHRLRHVGWNDDPHFAIAAFDRIFDATAGIPRRINALCDRLLLGAFLSEQHVVSATDVDAVAAELVDELGHGQIEVGDTSTQHVPTPRSSVAHGPINGTAASEDRIRELDRRIGLLESSNNMLYGMLNKVLQALRVESDRNFPT